MEKPSLRMKTGQQGVIRDPDLRAGRTKLIECALFCAVGVDGRENTERLALSAMRADRLHERTHAAPADERHHDVDGVRGRGLGSELVADLGLTLGIREDSRIEKRGEWSLD